MALLHIESFDWTTTVGDYTNLYTAAPSTAQVANGGRRTSTNSLYINGSSAGYLLKPLASNYSTLIIGFAYKQDSTGSNRGFMTLLDGATAQLGFTVLTTGEIQVTRGLTNGTVLGTTAAGTIAATQWNYIEVKAVFSSTVGAVTVRVNNTVVLTLTGVDTTGSANDYANAVKLGYDGGVAPQGYYDDWVILDTSGSAPNNDFLGDIRVDCQLPNANGNYSQFTGSDGNSTDNYLLVDEATPNSDTDYVQTSTATDKDSYGFADLSHSPPNVFGVKAVAIAKKDDAGTRSLKLFTRRSSTDYAGASQALTTSYAGYAEMYALDPSTSAAWTQTNLNAAEFGIECV